MHSMHVIITYKSTNMCLYGQLDVCTKNIVQRKMNVCLYSTLLLILQVQLTLACWALRRQVISSQDIGYVK